MISLSLRRRSLVSATVALAFFAAGIAEAAPLRNIDRLPSDPEKALSKLLQGADGLFVDWWLFNSEAYFMRPGERHSNLSDVCVQEAVVLRLNEENTPTSLRLTKRYAEVTTKPPANRAATDACIKGATYTWAPSEQAFLRARRELKRVAGFAKEPSKAPFDLKCSATACDGARLSILAKTHEMNLIWVFECKGAPGCLRLILRDGNASAFEEYSLDLTGQPEADRVRFNHLSTFTESVL